MKNYLALLRAHQWVKNLFILLPLFFSGEWMDYADYQTLILGFLSFSLIASSIYIINDLLDIESDRQHPEKKNRPIAAGIVQPLHAIIVSLIIFFSGIVIGFQLNKSFFYIELVYISINILYSIKLKHIPILDITLIAIGFVLRLFAGGELTDVILSKWIVILTFLLALLLAVAKRRDDVLLSKDELQMRKSIDGYNLSFINSVMAMMGSVIIVAYLMYATSLEIIERLNNDKVYLTSIFVIIGLMRYFQITLVKEKSGSPTKILLKDIFIQICILLWILSFYFLIYFHQ